MYLAAVFSNGRVATGRHHGEAFSRLSEEDQNSDLVSGHVNDDGTFTSELNYLNKEIILVRHAESMWNAELSDNLDSPLTNKGVSQAQATARFLKRNVDCRNFIGYTSPFDRCILTSMPIRRQTGVRFFVKSDISEISNQFPDEGVNVPCRCNTYLDLEWCNYSGAIFYREPPNSFLERLISFLDHLPARSIVVTHGSVVQTLVRLALGCKLDKIPEWDNSIGNASVTYIKDGTLVWMAKNVA